MAKCKNCGKSGLFLSVNKSGLCNPCSVIVAMELENCMRIIKDSISIVDSTKNAATAISRINDLRFNLNKLIEYEKKGIKLLTVPAAQTLAELERDHDEMIMKAINIELTKTIQDVLELKTTKAKTKRFADLQKRITEEYQPALKSPKALLPVIEKVSKLKEQSMNL